jgi:hypothetical protein
MWMMPGIYHRKYLARGPHLHSFNLNRFNLSSDHSAAEHLIRKTYHLTERDAAACIRRHQAFRLSPRYMIRGTFHSPTEHLVCGTFNPQNIPSVNINSRNINPRDV